MGYGDGQTIAAQLSVRNGRSAIEFYTGAFGAVEDYRVGGTDDEPPCSGAAVGGGAAFWVADESPAHDRFCPESLGGSTTRMLLIAEDPQAVIDRTIAAGATEIYPANEAHGWLLGRVEDPFGHHWEIGRPLIHWPPAPHTHAHA